MNISGIRPGIGFSEYNDIQIKRQPEAEVVAPEVKGSEVNASGSAAVSTPAKAEDFSAVREKQTFGAYDFANQYKPGVTYSMKGSQSDIKSLDVEKAVSAMEKDTALHQYQYFVGDAPTTSLADTPIRGAENFTL